jgi:hypothetical protein
MTQVTIIGLDFAKPVFQVHGVEAAGAVGLRRQLKRRQMEPRFTRSEVGVRSDRIGLEAGAGSRNRTDTPVKEQVFETCASTSSAMPARGQL